jgi:hypothetical protein
MTAQLPSRERLAEIHKLAAKSDKYIYHLRADEVEAMTRFVLAAYEQEPVAYSLIFRNMDGVLNSSINTNTTFSTREKAEAYGREEGMRPSLMARLSGLLMKILILLLFLSTPDPRQSCGINAGRPAS